MCLHKHIPLHPVPKGWYLVAHSKDLPPGKVIPLKYFATDLVLFRTESGEPCVFDAFCPHLGAHLGYGGKVKGNAIQCPFHGWTWNHDGHCIDVPFCSKVPSKVQIRSWPVSEVNGMIFVYYDALGNPPTWYMPEFSEFVSKQWVTWHKIYKKKIRTHVQEIGENNLDTIHFNHLHGTSFGNTNKSTLDMSESIWTHSASYEINIPIITKMFGVREYMTEYTSLGLGCSRNLISLKVKEKSLLQWRVICFNTPIDHENVEIQCIGKLKKFINVVFSHFFAELLAKTSIKELEKDIVIWKHKAYIDSPILSKSEENIRLFRQWASKLYS